MKMLHSPRWSRATPSCSKSSTKRAPIRTDPCSRAAWRHAPGRPTASEIQHNIVDLNPRLCFNLKSWNAHLFCEERLRLFAVFAQTLVQLPFNAIQHGVDDVIRGIRTRFDAVLDAETPQLLFNTALCGLVTSFNHEYSLISSYFKSVLPVTYTAHIIPFWLDRKPRSQGQLTS